jgi:hydrogenase expression/formation protein HypC
MCLGSIVRLSEAWDEDGARVGRLDDGSVVSLAFLPDARAGEYVLVHVGIPVEVLDPEAAREALALRAHEQAREEARR